MLKETEETVVFFLTFLSLVAFQWGVGGPPLGPRLASLMLRSCLHTVPQFFGDDTALKIDSNNTIELQTLTNTELANINVWMTANNLVLNANKTCLEHIYQYA